MCGADALSEVGADVPRAVGEDALRVVGGSTLCVDGEDAPRVVGGGTFLLLPRSIELHRSGGDLTTSLETLVGEGSIGQRGVS